MKFLAIRMAIGLQLVVSAAGQDWMTRIGGMSGSRSAPPDPARKQVEVTEANPMKVRAAAVSAAEVKPLFDEQIASMYAVADNGAMTQTHRFRYSGNGWERESVGYTGSRVRIMQHLGGQRYLARYGSTDSSMFVIDLDGGPFADDTTLHIRIEDTGQVYSYTSVLGANKTVRVVRSMPEPSLRAPTYEEFVRAVKDGQTFDVLRDASLPCPECRAVGFVKVKDRDGRLGVRNVCPVCTGKKTVQRRVLCRIAAD